jgi:hypothetical protein
MELNHNFNDIIKFSKITFPLNWNIIMKACNRWDNLNIGFTKNKKYKKEYVARCDKLDDTVILYDMFDVANVLSDNMKWYNSIKDKLK